MNPGYYVHRADVDSGSGVLTVNGTWGFGAGGDPIQPPNPPQSYASLSQILDPNGPVADVVTVTATFIWSGGALLESGGADVDRADLKARVEVAGCDATFIRRVYSNGVTDQSQIGPSGANCSGTASAGLVEVTRTYLGANVTGLTTFPIGVTLDAETSGLENLDVGQWALSGGLRVEVVGTAWTAASSTLLSVPEAGEAAGAVAAIAALAMVATRPRDGPR